MKNNSEVLRTLRLFLLAALLSACTFPASTSDEVEAHFGRPSDGDVIMLGESFDLLANGSSTGEEVSRALFFADGIVVGEASNVAGSNIVASYRWTPPEAGLYTLQIAAQRGSEYFYSDTINVCVLPFQIAPGHPLDIYAHGYEGDCVIPERDASAVPGPPRTDTVSVSPQELTYVPNYFNLCPDQTRFLNFKFYIEDPSDDVVFAAIALEVSPALMGRISGETTLALTLTGERLPHTKLFVGSMDVHLYLERSLTSPETGEGLSGELSWIARAFGRDGAVLIEEGPFIIPVNPVSCEGTPPPPAETESASFAPEVETSPTPISSLPTTFTLTRNAVCRAGPGLDYKIAEYINNGDTVEVLARSEDAVWFVVLLPNGVRCWVSTQLGSPDGDPNLLPIEAAPIISVPTDPNGNENEGEEEEEEEESGGNVCVEPATCGQNEIYDGCNCVPPPKP